MESGEEDLRGGKLIAAEFLQMDLDLGIADGSRPWNEQLGLQAAIDRMIESTHVAALRLET